MIKLLFKKRTFILFVYVFLFFAYGMKVCVAGSTKADLNKANRLYEKGKFDEALKIYNKALIDLPNSEKLNFNIGTALYKKGDYDKAIESFNRVLTTEDRNLESKSNYNIGNCKYKAGRLKENTDISSSVNLYKEALNYYKRAVDLDNGNEDAKFNHEFVEKRLKMLLDKMKKQKKQNKTKENRKNKKEKTKEAQKQKKSKGKNGKGNKSEKEKSSTELKKANKKKEREKGKPSAKSEMSKEQAKKLIERYGNEEKPLENHKKRKGHWQEDEVLKDW